MKSNLKLVLFVFAAFAVAETTHYLRAQNMNQNPSQTASPQNPSQTTTPQNPSQAAPGQNPSLPNPVPPAPGAPIQSTGTLPNPTLPGPVGPVVPNAPLNSNALPPAAAPKSTDAQLSVRVRESIVQAPPASGGARSTVVNGVSVTDLNVSAKGGKVVLRGVVHSEKDKADAAARAEAAAGAGNVQNELIVR